MKIIYEDEYGADLHEGSQITCPPSIGDNVILDEEEYRVKSRTFYPIDDAVVITVTQTVTKQVQKESNGNSRLSEMQNAILAITKRQDVSEKKGRVLREHIGSIRSHINSRIQQEKKDI